MAAHAKAYRQNYQAILPNIQVKAHHGKIAPLKLPSE